MSESGQLELTPYDASLSVVTNFIIFPIDLRDIRPILAKNAYQLTPLTYLVPRKPTRVGTGGTIARKEQFTVNMDSDIKSIGILGKSSEKIVDYFEEVIKIIETDLEVDITSNVLYYEYISHYTSNSEKMPVQQFSKFFEKLEKFAALEKIIGLPLSNFGFRLVPKNTNPNQVEWFDIAFEPEIVNSRKYYYGCVFRSKNYEQVVNWINNEEDYIQKILEVIENE